MRSQCLARKFYGGKQLSDSFYTSQPRVVSQREIFGSVVCLYTYENIDRTIHQANAIPFAFQTAAISQNIDTIMYALSFWLLPLSWKMIILHFVLTEWHLPVFFNRNTD